MEQTNEGRRFYDEDEEETSVHLEKLNSFWYVIFKYWMLLCTLWTLKELISSFSNDKSSKVEEDASLFDQFFTFSNDYIFKIWLITNCALVFEGLRRKNLKILEKAITFMETHVLVEIVITFFGLTTERGLAKGKAAFQKQFPEFKGDNSSMTLIAVVVLLVWGLYYHFAYIYGAKKVRDALKAHHKARRSL